jgi:hypothetical protein
MSSSVILPWEEKITTKMPAGYQCITFPYVLRHEAGTEIFIIIRNTRRYFSYFMIILKYFFKQNQIFTSPFLLT